MDLETFKLSKNATDPDWIWKPSLDNAVKTFKYAQREGKNLTFLHNPEV